MADKVWKPADPMSDDYLRYMIVVVTAEAATLIFALRDIRAKRFDRAMEQLERGLDRCVMCLGHMWEKADPNGRENLRNALSLARTYRSRHPREAGFGVDESDLTAIRDAAETARKILEELK